MINAFAKTAKLCKDAGVDGVEIHAVLYQKDFPELFEQYIEEAREKLKC